MFSVEEAYNIRKEKFSNPNHPDLVRVSCLIQYFYKEISKNTDEYKKTNTSIVRREEEDISEINESSIVSPFRLNKLVKMKLQEDRATKEAKLSESQNKARSVMNESLNNQSNSVMMSDSRNTSEIFKDGFGTLFGLFGQEDKINTNSYVVNFVLSLSSKYLNFNIYLE
jgi:hypothetical protein